MFRDVSELYQSVILDHNRSPRNYGKMADANFVGEGKNPTCGDRFTVFLKIENEAIREISFHGSGCAISKASASVMTNALKGKALSDVNPLVEQFQRVIKGSAETSSAAGELDAFVAVRKFPMRVKCAMLPWQALVAALKSPVTPS